MDSSLRTGLPYHQDSIWSYNIDAGISKVTLTDRFLKRPTGVDLFRRAEG